MVILRPFPKNKRSTIACQVCIPYTRDLSKEIGVNLGSKVEEVSHVKAAILPKKKEIVYNCSMANIS